MNDGYDRAPLIDLLLTALLSKKKGCIAVTFPNLTNIAFYLAVLAAVESLKRQSSRIASHWAEHDLMKGQLLRLSPDGYVYEYDGYFPYENNGFFRLKIPGTSEVHSLPVEDISRLTPTAVVGDSPPKAYRPRPTPMTALERLIGLRTGGNLAALPNCVRLLGPRASTLHLAEETRLGWRRGAEVTAMSSDVSKLVTWGRIDEAGRLICEHKKDRDRPPIIAVTHKLEWLLKSLKVGEVPDDLIAIIDDVRRVDDPEGLLRASERVRVLVLGTYTERDALRELQEQGCNVWAPNLQLLSQPSIGV